MDEGSSEILVEDNTIYNLAKSPIRFHRAERNTLRNNRLVHAPGVPAFRYNNSQAKSMTFEDNTLIEEKVWLPPSNDPAVIAAPPN
jgi:parallel beta-helix repeat protein